MSMRQRFDSKAQPIPLTESESKRMEEAEVQLAMAMREIVELDGFTTLFRVVQQTQKALARTKRVQAIVEGWIV